MRIMRRFAGWLLASSIILTVSYVAWAASIGEYTGGTEVWGITEMSGDIEIFCNRETILLDVRDLNIQSVTWSDLDIETDGVVIRTLGDGSAVIDFTLPGT